MSRTELRNTIIQHSLNLFRTHGIKAVRMDDVAKDLKMSKRTLYELFEDKEQLLLECVKQNAGRQARKYAEFMAQSNGLMDILCFFVKNSLEKLADFNAQFFVDVLKYKSVRDYIESKRQQDANVREEFLKRGIEEGLLVSGVNFTLLARINKAAVESIVRDKVYEQYPPQEIFYTFTMVFLRGILTEKGQKELELYLNNLKSTDLL